MPAAIFKHRITCTVSSELHVFTPNKTHNVVFIILICFLIIVFDQHNHSDHRKNKDFTIVTHGLQPLH